MSRKRFNSQRTARDKMRRKQLSTRWFKQQHEQNTQLYLRQKSHGIFSVGNSNGSA
jgi:hypothetical protein